jgi:multicomponent Na+:H+ antiporter subunit G
MIEYVVLGTLILGAFLMFVAAVGVVRMPDVFMRMQAASKASSLGVGLMMAAVALYFGELAVTTRALAAVGFIFLTVPVATHLIGRAAYRTGATVWKGTQVEEMPTAEEGKSQ